MENFILNYMINTKIKKIDFRYLLCEDILINYDCVKISNSDKQRREIEVNLIRMKQLLISPLSDIEIEINYNSDEHNINIDNVLIDKLKEKVIRYYFHTVKSTSNYLIDIALLKYYNEKERLIQFQINNSIIL